MRFWLNLLWRHWRDALGHLRTPVLRRRLLFILNPLFWSILRPVAALYRRGRLRRVRIVAVTGTFGKTTAARATMAALGLSESSRVESNYLAQVALTLLRIAPGRRHAVVELGIDGVGQMAEYAATVRPDVAIVTSIGSEHHTSLGMLDVTRAEKAKIVEALPPDGLAVLNGDDPNVLWMKGRTKARVVTFGFGPDCDARASDVRPDWPRGMRFTLHAGGPEREVSTRLIGRHQVRAILAAAAVAMAEGLDLDGAIARLARLPPTAGRLQPVRLPSGAIVIRDDWKGAREVFPAAFDALAGVPARRRIVVMGMVSELDRRKGAVYQALGERVARAASLVIFCGHVRYFRSLRVGAVRGGMAPGAVVHAGISVRRAIAALPADLGPGDVVLTRGDNAQRLERVALALQGRAVRCDRLHCPCRSLPCERCPALARGPHLH